MTEILSQSDLDALREWPTPAISNAIELFDIRSYSLDFIVLPSLNFIVLGSQLAYRVNYRVGEKP